MGQGQGCDKTMGDRDGVGSIAGCDSVGIGVPPLRNLHHFHTTTHEELFDCKLSLAMYNEIATQEVLDCIYYTLLRYSIADGDIH